MAESAGAGDLAGLLLPPVVLAGFVLMAVVTLVGAFLALRGRGLRQAWLGAAAGVLLVIALLHLLPDASSAADAARIWPGLVPVTALGSFVLVLDLGRLGKQVPQVLTMLNDDLRLGHLRRNSSPRPAVATGSHRDDAERACSH